MMLFYVSFKNAIHFRHQIFILFIAQGLSLLDYSFRIKPTFRTSKCIIKKLRILADSAIADWQFGDRL